MRATSNKDLLNPVFNGIRSTVFIGELKPGLTSGLFLFSKSIHRVLVHDYSRPVKLQANNQEVPFDALVAKVDAISLNSENIRPANLWETTSTSRRD